MFRRLFIPFICAVCLTLTVSAHPGKTDANGGHYDRSTGEYHYHHGYAAHQHPDGVCPYNTSVEEPSEPNKMTFAELWNEGYLCARDDMVKGTHDAESKDVIREIFNWLYDENRMNIDDPTYPEDVGYTEQEAFSEGYNQAISDYENLPDEDPSDSGYVKTEDGEWVLEDSIIEEADETDESMVDYDIEPVNTLGNSSLEKSNLSLNHGTLLVLVSVLIGAFCVLLFRQNAKQAKASHDREEFSYIEESDHADFAPLEEADGAVAPEPPADLGALRYGPVGTGWLKFLTYVGLPLQAVINYFTLSDADLSNLAPAAYVPYFALLAYLVAFPLAAAILLHFRQPKAYFLIQYLLFSNALLNLCLVFLFPSAAIDTVQAAVGSIIWGFIWFFYLKKRRFLFEQEGISRAEFDAIGVKVSYGIVAAFAIAAASLAYLAYQ